MTAAPTYDAPIERVLRALGDHGVRGAGAEKWKALCPAHDDTNPSLAITVGGDGRALVHCHTGCTPEAVVAAVGLTMADLMPPRDERDQRPVEVAAYPYLDEKGLELYQNVRFVPKKFLARRKVQGGSPVWNLKGVRRVLYRLPDLIAKPDAPVFVVEGEKDVDNLRKLGLVATTSVGGNGQVGQWKVKAFCEPLRGRTVVIIPDNDEPGEEYAAAVKAGLDAVKANVRIMKLPGVGKDASDWIAAGGTAEQLLELVKAAGAATVGSAGIAWADPAPIADGLPPVPALDARLVPEALRSWVFDVSDRLQCPPDFIAATAMVATGAVVGRACGIRPKRLDSGWIEVPNLWGALVAPPGLCKSPAMAAALGPIKALAARAAKRHEDASDDIKVEEKILKAKLAKAERNLADATPEQKEEFKSLLRQTVSAPAARRYIVNDTTIEKLGIMLSQNPRGILHHRDELTGWLASMQREGHENDRSFYTQSWSGMEPYDFDRIGRADVKIAACCVSVLGTIQPEPLAYHLRAALRGGQAADGFMQRLQVTVYPDVPSWKDVDRSPDAKARDQAFAVFERLDAIDLPPGPYGEIPTLQFDDAAQALFTEWRGDLEARVRQGAEHPAFYSHLAKNRKLVPAIALLGHLIDGGGPRISLASMQRAAAWADYLELHARRLYASVMMADEIAAITLLDKIRRGVAKLPLVARDIHRRCWSGLSTPDDVEGALSVLETHHYVRRYEVPTGGRPRVEYDAHPSVIRRAA